MGKIISIIYLIFVSKVVFATSTVTLYSTLLDKEEPEVSLLGNGKLIDKTKDALLSIDYIEKRADYFVFKLKNLTFGEYTDNVMYIAPLATGKVEFSMYDVNVYYDHFKNKSGIKYKFSF